jgi:uncharacterized protein (TIGR01244 family)
MSLTIQKHVDDFATAAQIELDEVEKIAALGYKTIINNRPDGEGGMEQAASALVAEKAASLGVAYYYIPVISGQITPQQVQNFADTLAKADKPVLAYCRSGARSTMLWQMAQSF